MDDWLKKRIAILGLGREGQVAWKYLRSRFPRLPLALLDEATPDPTFARRLSSRDQLVTGPFSEAMLDSYDVLLRSPGVSPYRDSIRRARGAGTSIVSPSTLWFEAHPDARTICITGTKGKSTTAALIAHMLEACGNQVCLAGNIGLPLLACEGISADWWVIELSSYQLVDLQAIPDISVLLNLSAEHLDWHGSLRQYQQDKLRLVHLAGEGPVVANASDPVLHQMLAGRKNTVWFSDESGYRVDDGELWRGDTRMPFQLPDGLRGVHNLSNIAAALTAVECAGCDPATALGGLHKFRCLPHRLQLVGERQGVRFVNDSISSTPMAMVAALESFAGEKITLIIGGLDRGLDWAPYMQAVSDNLPYAVIGVPDNGPSIIGLMRERGLSPPRGLHCSSDLAAAIELAKSLTPAGGIALMSPGAPSFPQFRDYRDRGRQFALLSGFELEEREVFRRN